MKPIRVIVNDQISNHERGTYSIVKTHGLWVEITTVSSSDHIHAVVIIQEENSEIGRVKIVDTNNLTVPDFKLDIPISHK